MGLPVVGAFRTDTDEQHTLATQASCFRQQQRLPGVSAEVATFDRIADQA